MRINRVISILVALVVSVSLTGMAQKSSTPTAPKYDVSKEVTIKGTIEDIREPDLAKGEAGVHLMVKTGADLIEVRLCPAAVLKDFAVTFEKGQEIQVTGSKINIDEKDVILAREVVSGNSTVVLRDKHGAPVWTWMKKG